MGKKEIWREKRLSQTSFSFVFLLLSNMLLMISFYNFFLRIEICFWLLLFFFLPNPYDDRWNLIVKQTMVDMLVSCVIAANKRFRIFMPCNEGAQMNERLYVKVFCMVCGFCVLQSLLTMQMVSETCTRIKICMD